MNQLTTLPPASDATAASASDAIFAPRRAQKPVDDSASFEMSLDRAAGRKEKLAADRRRSDDPRSTAARGEPADSTRNEGVTEQESSADAAPADEETSARIASDAESPENETETSDVSPDPEPVDPDADAEADSDTDDGELEPFDIEFSIGGLTFSAAFGPATQAAADADDDALASHSFTLPPGLGMFGDQTSLLTVSLNAGPALATTPPGTATLAPLPGQAAAATPGGPADPAAAVVSPELAAASAASGGTDADTPQGDTSQRGPGAGATVATPATGTAAAASAAAAGAFGDALAGQAVEAAGPAASGPASTSPASASALLQPANALIGEGESDTDALNTARLNRGLNSAVSQKGGNVTLRLTPPELGTVRIQLNLQGTSVTAQFHAETESARTLLTQQLAQLKTNLEGQGLSVEKIGVQSMAGPTNASNTSQQQSASQQQSQHQPDADGRSRGQHQPSSQQQQQQHAGRDADAAEEDRARDNLAAARALFGDLLGQDPAAA